MYQRKFKKKIWISHPLVEAYIIFATNMRYPATNIHTYKARSPKLLRNVYNLCSKNQWQVLSYYEIYNFRENKWLSKKVK